MTDTGVIDRLERLERSQRRWKTGTALGTLVVISVAILGQATTREAVPNVIRARSFIVVDENDKPIHRLSELGLSLTGDHATLFGWQKRAGEAASKTRSANLIDLGTLHVQGLHLFGRESTIAP